MSPKVSVIIPAFNAGMFIDKALESILAQTYAGKIEIIVIDDASSDNTRAIVNDFSRRHRQIVCVPNHRGKGPSGARNTGLLKAAGEYVAFLDADDLWLPDHLATGLEFLDNNSEIDAVFFNFNLIEYETGQLIGDWFSRHSFAKQLNVKEIGDRYYLILDDMFNSLIDESFIHLQSVVIRKRTLIGILFNEGISRSEDRDFCIRLHLFAKARFAFKNLVTGIYYRHENSLTSETLEKGLAMILDHISIFASYLSIFRLDEATTAKLKRIVFHKLMIASYLHRKLGSYRLAVSTLGRSFRYRIDITQFKELAKIAAACLLGNALQRTKGPV